jgi:RNA polymerase sigma factor (sigma-70 family)
MRSAGPVGEPKGHQHGKPRQNATYCQEKSRRRDPRPYFGYFAADHGHDLRRGRHDGCGRRREKLEQAICPELWDANISVGETSTVERIVLCKAFSALSAEQREVMALKIFEGMTFKEIADTIHISMNTAASRYRYAVERLRRALEENDNG